MALEDDIRALTEQLKRNNNILEAGLKRSGIAASGNSRPATRGTTRKPAAPTEDKVREVVGAYLATKNASEKAVRKENVKAMLAHFGVSLASEIPEESRAEAIGYIEQWEAGETPNFMDEGGEEVDDVLG